jgi:hypothetical protein
MSNGVAPLGDIDFRTISGPGNIVNANMGVGTGLKTDPTLIKYVLPNEIDNFLKSVKYEPYVTMYRDCDNQAYWGWAHLRHRFPGVPSGIASGINDQGIAHAEIMYWVEGSAQPIFWDQNRKSPVGNYQTIYSAIAFPWGSIPCSIPPFASFTPLANPGFFYNESYHVYPKQAIVNYLTNRGYDTQCGKDPVDHKIYNPHEFETGGRWTSYDDALWGVVHLRKQFIGCAVGIARGKKVDGDLPSTIIIWHYPNDDNSQQPVPCYWDTKANRLVNFNPERIIY